MSSDTNKPEQHNVEQLAIRQKRAIEVYNHGSTAGQELRFLDRTKRITRKCVIRSKNRFR